VVDRLFERRATERAAQFADCLRKRFGDGAPAGAAAQVSDAPSPARGWLARIKQWLARLWRHDAKV
jgi:hypothetical protein